jgi:hypothetical protein
MRLGDIGCRKTPEIVSVEEDRHELLLGGALESKGSPRLLA